MSLLGRRTIFRLGSGALALGLVGTAVGVALPQAASAASSSAPGVTKTSITIGALSSLTGPYGSEFSPRTDAMMAAIDAQNAKGGVFGRKIKVVTEDDQSSPAANLTAAQSLVDAKGVFMIAENSSFAASSAGFLTTNGIPAVHVADVPQLGSLPNFFIADGAINPSPTVASTTTGLIFKEIGATKAGALSQSISTAATAAANETIASVKAAGLHAGYLNTTLPATITDWTPYVLGVKSSGTDGMNPALTPAASLAFLTAANQQGVKIKLLLDTGYDFDFLTDPTTEPLMQGAYVLSPYVPSALNTAGTKAEAKNLKKYDNDTNPPDYVTTSGYAVGVLLIRALQAAGPHPTRAGLIKNMRAVKGYTANGLLPVPVNFKNALKPAFQPPNQLAYGNCQYVLKVQGKKFVPVSKKPVCGKLITVG